MLGFAILVSMNSKQPKWHVDQKNMKIATTVLGLSKAVLIMAGDLAVGMYKSFHPHPYYHTFCEHRKLSFESTLSRLKKEGYFKITKRNNESIFVLTRKGKQRREEALLRIK